MKELIRRYDISYIFVGGQEQEKYGTALNDSLLQSLGSIVYEDDMTGTYIVKVNWGIVSAGNIIWIIQSGAGLTIFP